MDQAGSLEVFFQDAIDQALREQGVAATSLTEHYLVRLLATYAHHPIDEDQPLALKLMQALEADPRERRQRLREVGDTSLFVSGFWTESFARRTVDVEYYIGLGGSAYGELAKAGTNGVWARDPYGEAYEALAENFARFVKVLMVVSRRFMPAASPQDLLRLYERWLKTGSTWAARKLAAAGVVPQRGGGKLQ
jgi:hypothetical protein